QRLNAAFVQGLSASGTASAQLPQLSVSSLLLAPAARVSNHFRLPSIPAHPGVTGEPVQCRMPSSTGAPARELELRTSAVLQPGTFAAASGSCAGTVGCPAGVSAFAVAIAAGDGATVSTRSASP